MADKKFYDVVDIMKVLPHRFPILLVDRVTEVREDGGKGYKNVTINEDFFNGHFPGAPVMPGVLQVEGMAQCAGYVVMKSLMDKGEFNPEENVIFFMKIDGVKFRKPVRPGDRLDYEITITKMRGKIGVFAGVCKVDGEVSCEAEMTAMIVKKDEANK
ncbi:MAG: 3-hydroxyacyl-[acyl-carrier-protein] dehydratase FabZ [Spirochaetes bacterium GWF1_51_8]|nr:MAG: 3-hydroxyacyl-[acyl-carrier-protein] dehydratase FabZ [Spirochaetes bacterium GWF1_51_8]